MTDSMRVLQGIATGFSLSCLEQVSLEKMLVKAVAGAAPESLSGLGHTKTGRIERSHGADLKTTTGSGTQSHLAVRPSTNFNCR